MGKLAERYADAAKSGVYRVTSAEIPLEAAGEANARVVELGADGVQSLVERIGQTIARNDRRPHVVLIRQEVSALLDEMDDLARHCREHRLPFFALVVDPAGALDLPALYKESPA
jgi:hypothetical protein